MPAVVFIPSGKRIEVAAGTPLSDACGAAGFPLPAPCGGRGLCGKCRVQVLQGDVPLDQARTGCVNASLLVSGWRAACVTRVAGDLVIAEPSAISGQTDVVALTDFRGRQPQHDNSGGSGFWRCDVALEPPAARDAADDAARLLAALKANGATDGGRSIGLDGIRLSLLAELPRLLRERRFRCRVVGMGRHVLGVQNMPEDSGGEETAPALGLAVDLGTTTLAAALCDVETGEIFSVVGAANPQAAWGDDVVSRIEYAGRSNAHRDEMRLAVIEKISSLADEARRRAGFDGNGAGDILVIAAAGNTVMNHLLLGVDPAALAVSPFVPAFNGVVEAWGRDIGWPVETNAVDPLVLVLPNIGSYVGGDVTAGLLAHDILRSKEPVLYLDVGTNGEMALVADGRAYACATAAGPAFEGARIGQGMRAASGAVSRVDWADDAFACEVIGGGRPRGICGTGLLDAVAALLEAGIVDAGGRMATPEEVEEFGLSAGAAAAVHMNGSMPAVWLVAPEGRLPGVEITQRDVREVQLAKGAIGAGIRVLLRKAGLPASRIDRVVLAGGFGSFLRPASALAIGLLPAGIAPERIQSVGNAALAGARLYLHSRDERRSAEEICAKVEYVELSGRHDFERAFAEEMLFPGGRGEEERE